MDAGAIGDDDASIVDTGVDARASDASPSDDGNTPNEDAATPDAGSGVVPPTGTPQTVLLDGARLLTLQHDLAGGASGSAAQKAAFQNLVAAADGALNAGTWSVTTKSAEFIVNNDPHEYVSWGPYWWPKDASPPSNAGTRGKCPYVTHDGLRNPDVDRVTDRHGLHATSEAILELALAWYLTGKSEYADQAERIARAWYLDPATSMRPEMNYAQQAGPCGGGTPQGLIEASGGYMTDALDGLAILALDDRSTGWTVTDQAGIKAWMTQFVGWLTSSSLAKGELDAANNHGTWYDALVSSIQLFLGNTDAAKAIVNLAKTKRIDAQIKGDGTMPQELARTTSWHYSNYNISGLCRLAGVGRHVGIDLWTYQASGGGSLVKAIDYILPTATTASPPGPWAKYNDIETFDAVYQAESFYSIHAAAEYAQDAKAQAVLAASPVPVQVPGHFCSGERFPTGSDFCQMTAGSAKFADLQPAGTAPVDMWPVLPTCRMPIN